MCNFCSVHTAITGKGRGWRGAGEGGGGGGATQTILWLEKVCLLIVVADLMCLFSSSVPNAISLFREILGNYS